MSYRYTIETENPIVTDGNKMFNCKDGKLRLKIVEANPWHTGTPTEKGEYLCEYYVNEISKEFNIRHYDPDDDWFVKNWEKAKKNFRMIRWQRYYEPYKEEASK